MKRIKIVTVLLLFTYRILHIFTVPEYAFQFIGYDIKTSNTSHKCHIFIFVIPVVSYVCAEKIISH